MYAVPSWYAAAIARSDTTLSAHIDVLLNGQKKGSSLPVESVTLTLNRAAAARRVAKVVVTPDGSTVPVPAKFGDFLTPCGYEFALYFDVTDVHKRTVTIPGGVFQLRTTTLADTGADLTMTLDGSDRSVAIAEAKYLVPYVIPAGVSIESAVSTMVENAWHPAGSSRLPLKFSLPVTGLTTPNPSGTINAGKDPWTSATDLAASAGCELFFDVSGTCVMQATPNQASAAPVWTTSQLLPTGLKGLTRTFTREGVFSAFEIIGEGSDTVTEAGGFVVTKHLPIDAYIEEDDPSSPIYAKGAFGVVPNSTRSTTISNLAQGEAACRTMLRQQKGTYDALAPLVLPNPALDIDDVVSITGSRINVAGNYVLDGYALTYHYSGSMTLNTRPVGAI
jgi:hypothetical protein